MSVSAVVEGEDISTKSCVETGLVMLFKSVIFIKAECELLTSRTQPSGGSAIIVTSSMVRHSSLIIKSRIFWHFVEEGTSAEFSGY